LWVKRVTGSLRGFSPQRPRLAVSHSTDLYFPILLPTQAQPFTRSCSIKRINSSTFIALLWIKPPFHHLETEQSWGDVWVDVRGRRCMAAVQAWQTTHKQQASAIKSCERPVKRRGKRSRYRKKKKEKKCGYRSCEGFVKIGLWRSKISLWRWSNAVWGLGCLILNLNPKPFEAQKLIKG
jgi:hypothetical protein